MPEAVLKYLSVQEHLTRRIATMSVGDQMPTEPVLCMEYGVSRITVRRAVDELIRAGLLVRQQGRGTFVTDPRNSQAREVFTDEIAGLYRQQAKLGREVTATVLHNRLVRNEWAAAALRLDKAKELVELERLRYVEGVLHQHVVTYLPAARFTAVLDHDFARGSLYEYLESVHGVDLAQNDLLVRLEVVDDLHARALNIEKGTCVLAMESTVFDDQDLPVIFGVTRHTPSHSQLSFSLRNHPTTGGH